MAAPPTRVVKLNTDAAVWAIGIGLGFIAWNATGGFIFSGTMFLPQRVEPQTTEVLALREALIHARQWGYDRIVVELDCLGNISALFSGDLPLSYMGLILEEVANVAASFTNCSFQHIKRTLNVPAHELGQFALIFDLGNVWVGECPETIAPFVLADII